MFYFAFASHHFTEESESKCIEYKVEKAEEHFDAKNWAFDARLAEIERGKTVVRFWPVNKLHSFVSYYTYDTHNKHRQ